MKYQVKILPTALKSLQTIDRKNIKGILNKISWLAEHISEIVHIPLRGKFSGLFKLRVGDYRIIYSVEEEERILTIYFVGHRKDIYQ